METDSSDGTNKDTASEWARPPLIGHDPRVGGHPNDLLRDETDDDQKNKFDSARAPSPPCSVSSVTSNRKLEWDSGADVGYQQQNPNPECLSTIERIALERGRNAFRLEPEGISSNTLQTVLPLAKSTPKENTLSDNSTKELEEKYYKLFGKNKNVGRRLTNSLNDLTEIELTEPKRTYSNKDLDKIKKQAIKSTSTSTMSTVISKNKKKSDKIIQTSINIPMKLSIGLQASDCITLNIEPNGIKDSIKVRKKDKPFCSKCNQKKKPIESSSSIEEHSSSSECVQVQTLENTQPIEVQASFEYLPATSMQLEDINELRKKIKAESQKSLVSSSESRSSKNKKKDFSLNKKTYSSDTLEKDIEKSLDMVKKILKGRTFDKEKKDKLIRKIVKRIVETNYADDSSSEAESTRAVTEVDKTLMGKSDLSTQRTQADSEVQACTDHSSVEASSLEQPRPQIEAKIPNRPTERPSKLLTGSNEASEPSSAHYYESTSASYAGVSSRSSYSHRSISLKLTSDSSNDALLEKKETVDSKTYNKQLHLSELQKQIDHLNQIKQFLEQNENTQICENFTQVVNLGNPQKKIIKAPTLPLAQWSSHHYLHQGSLPKSTQVPSNYSLNSPREIATQTFPVDFLNYQQTSNSQHQQEVKSPKKLKNSSSFDTDISSTPTPEIPKNIERPAKLLPKIIRNSTSSPCTDYTDTNISDVQEEKKQKIKTKNNNKGVLPKDMSKDSATKPTAYLLTFETEQVSEPNDSEIISQRRSPLQEVTVKIPTRKIAANRENRAPPIINGKTKRMTLQEFLREKRPDYVENAEYRRRCLEELQVLRELRQESRRKLISNFQNFPSQTENSLAEKKNKKFIRPKTFLFPEQEAKRVEIKKKEEYRTNRLMAEIFTKKLQKKVLKGQVNLSTNASVISTI